MPAVAEPDLQTARKPRYKMKLKNAEFIEEQGGKLAAGEVVIVDMETALRWLENGIATQAGPGEQTRRERLRAELATTLVPVADDDDEDDAPPARARALRRGRAVVPPKLVGAGVINSLDDVPDDVTVDDE